MEGRAGLVGQEGREGRTSRAGREDYLCPRLPLGEECVGGGEGRRHYLCLRQDIDQVGFSALHATINQNSKWIHIY